ncbi:hypothetical protein [Acetobacter malorum]|uniref:Uncharacterized protein n=1 Tax=Acetobacter malorum TaxID=178901 RepID=A0A1Y3GBR8_9PROT|nr:hypothetical protein [Acetobacter malorum]OUJ06302.1 hypothetical protein HK23_02365 [Acetobacter malorum]
MIIKASRITAESTHRHLYRHLMRTDENEEVRIVQGREFALAEAVKDARHSKRRYGLRHVILSPEQVTSPETFQKMVTLYQSEFGADPPLMIVEHQKKRADGHSYDRHWHVVFAETLANGRSLDSRFIRIRNEKVARFTELAFGHSLTSGKHNDAVIRALEVSSNQQMQRAATALKQAFWGEGDNPQSTFTDKAHQVTKRKAGKSVLPTIRAHLRRCWQEEGRVLLSFIERVAEEGYLIREGDKPDVWLIGKSGEAHLALHRVLGLKKKELVALLSDANRPVPLSPPRLTVRAVMASKPLPVAVPPEYAQRLEVLRSRIRPRWKRSECRAELIALPYQNIVRRLENSTLGDMLERLLAALIARMLNALFGVCIDVPPITADEARERIAKACAEAALARQQDVQEHFTSPEVQAALQERRLLKSCLVSSNPVTRQAMQEGAWTEALQSLRGKPHMPVHAVPRMPMSKTASHSGGL